MSDEDLRDELERLPKENEALKRGASSGIRMKVSEKGAVSIYGMGRFPVTLYKEQWLKLLAHPIHERLRLNQTERVDIATSTFPGTSVMWHTRFWKAAEDGLFMTTVNKTG